MSDMVKRFERAQLGLPPKFSPLWSRFLMLVDVVGSQKHFPKCIGRSSSHGTTMGIGGRKFYPLSRGAQNLKILSSAGALSTLKF